MRSWNNGYVSDDSPAAKDFDADHTIARTPGRDRSAANAGMYTMARETRLWA